MDYFISVSENEEWNLYIFIIINGNTTLLEPQPSLEDPARLVYSIVI
jgi:hypothetical protein